MGKRISLLKRIAELRSTDVAAIVAERIKDFERRRSEEELFSELCFCILAANYSAEGSLRIQKAIGKGFLELDEGELANELRALGYRFPNVRARYIASNRWALEELPPLAYEMEGREAREWLVKNIKGIGMKEASHFLRNVGRKDLAIVDFHILDVLSKEFAVKKPKSMTKKKYLEFEGLLQQLSKKARLSLAELDLYLWYLETGKVIK